MYSNNTLSSQDNQWHVKFNSVMQSKYLGYLKGFFLKMFVTCLCKKKNLSFYVLLIYISLKIPV